MTSNCLFPNYKPSTAYRYGCRCDFCRLGHNKTNKQFRQKAPKKPRKEKSRQMREEPIFIRPPIERVTSKAYGGC